MINDFKEYLNPGDLLVLNDTKVLKARLSARKSSGGLVEVLIERLLDGKYALAQARSNRKLQKGDSITIENSSIGIKILEKIGPLFKIEFDEELKVPTIISDRSFYRMFQRRLKKHMTHL